MHACMYTCMNAHMYVCMLVREENYYVKPGIAGDGSDASIQIFKCTQRFWKSLEKEELGTPVPSLRL